MNRAKNSETNSDNFQWLKASPFAHRGLYSSSEMIPENSIPAITKAIKHQFGVVLDVRLTADQEVVVFHDESLQRMCGAKINISELSSVYLKDYQLEGTEETIPLLSKVLPIINGKIPTIISIGQQDGVRHANNLICNSLLSYKGTIAIQSPDPLVLRWFSTYAPAFARGQLHSDPSDNKSGVLSNYLYHNYVRYGVGDPNYHCFDIQQLSHRQVEKARKKKLNVLAWNVRTHDDHQNAFSLFDNIIFEGIEPSSFS